MTPNSTFDVWTMTLRPGIKFNDGSALTSAVVKANFEALAASALTGIALKQVASVTTPDPMTVVYTLTGPNPTFPAGLTTQVGYVVGQAMIDQATANPNRPAHPGGHRALHLLPMAAQRPLHLPPATRTTGATGSPTSTRSPSSPSPTPPSVNRPSAPVGST